MVRRLVAPSARAELAAAKAVTRRVVGAGRGSNPGGDTKNTVTSFAIRKLPAQEINKVYLFQCARNGAALREAVAPVLFC